MEQNFDTLCDAITYAFRQEQTSMLSLDRICKVLESPKLFISSKSKGLTPCSSVTRRRISSTLSSSELFVRAGPPRACLWAIRPHNPLFLSDSAIIASIDSMLTTYGPLTTQQLIKSTSLSGVSVNLFERVLADHSDEFSMISGERWWFNNQQPPIKSDFKNISHALLFAFTKFPEGASVEELHRFLCLSTAGGSNPIVRRCISRELSRRSDLFKHISRARYILAEKQCARTSFPEAFKITSSCKTNQCDVPSQFTKPLCCFSLGEESYPLSLISEFDTEQQISPLNTYFSSNQLSDSMAKDQNDDPFNPPDFFCSYVPFNL